MTEIDVPDWVVERACIAYYNEPAWAFMSHKAECKEMMRAALTAALGAWVVPTEWQYRRNDPYDGCGVWVNLDDDKVHLVRDKPGYEVRALYDLRQEKPE